MRHQGRLKHKGTQRKYGSSFYVPKSNGTSNSLVPFCFRIFPAYLVTATNICESRSDLKLLSSALKCTIRRPASESTVVESIAVFSRGVALAFLNIMPALSNLESVAPVTLSELPTFKLKSTP